MYTGILVNQGDKWSEFTDWFYYWNKNTDILVKSMQTIISRVPAQNY